jgi:hypothetical protein
MPLRVTSPPPTSGAPAAPPVAASARPLGFELPAGEGAAVKRLLQRSSLDAGLPAVQPIRDPVGLALGMIARLVVAGSAAAAITLLLLGIVPLPFRLGAPPATEGALGATGASAKIEERLAESESANAIATPPARVATVTVRATPPTAPAAIAPVTPPPVAVYAAPAATTAAAAPTPALEPSALDAGEIERLVKRGEDYLAHGDIAAARLVLGRAVEARDAHAALSLAETYDPVVLRRLNVLGFKPDPGQARAWYERAAGYGSAEASRRLDALRRVEP